MSNKLTPEQFEQWYGDEINGWVCSKCYKKL